MGRIFGLALVAVSIYLAASLYLGESPLGLGGASAADEAPRSTAQRAGERVQQSFDEGTARREALLPD